MSVALRPSWETLQWAKAERLRRDAAHGYGLFPPETGRDRRWQGLVAERGFSAWLEKQGATYTYNGGVDDRPDFVIGGTAVALKCCHGLMLPDFYVWVPAQHRHRLPAQLFFCGFNERTSSLELLGGCPSQWFFEEADLIHKGERYSDTSRSMPNDSYRLSANRLTPPGDWLGVLVPSG